jgi:hypothetical protein
MESRFLFVIRPSSQTNGALETVWVPAMSTADLGDKFSAAVRRLGYDPDKLSYSQMVWVELPHPRRLKTPDPATMAHA